MKTSHSTDRSTDKFTLGRGEQATGQISSPKTPPLPVSPQKSRAVLYILLGILMAAMIGAYFDLYRRLTHSTSMDSEKLTRLAENLEDRFSSLSIKQARLKEQLTQKDTTDTQITRELTEKLKQAHTDLAMLKKKLAAKAGQTDLTQALAAMGTAREKTGKISAEIQAVREKTDALTTGLTAIQSKIEKVAADLSGEIAETSRLLDQTSKNLIALESRVDALKTAKLDRKTAEKLIMKKIDTQRATAAEAAKKLSAYIDRINANRRHISELDKNADVYAGEILKIKRQLNTLRAAVSNHATRPSPPPSPARQPAKPGQIIQQNLSE